MRQVFINKQILRRFVPYTICSCLFIAVISCKSAKRIAYFQDIPDSVSKQAILLNVASYQDPLLEAGDLLQITIRTIESPLPDQSGKVDFSNTPTELPNPGVPAFPIDKKGFIAIPILGKIKAEGLSTAAIRDSITLRASKYYKDPVVDVRLANFTVTVLGEVTRPGNYIITKEKSSVLDALGFAGDMTIYGKKENVLLIRNVAQQKYAARLDLNASSTFYSPYFYLKQGDVIFIEPNRDKLAAARDGGKTRNYALIASALSVLIILISRLTF